MPTTLTIKTSGTPLMKLFVDHTPVPVVNHSAQVSLASGEYALSWVVLGAPSDSYSIELTAPATAAWKTSATLDSSGKDAGIHWVEL